MRCPNCNATTTTQPGAGGHPTRVCHRCGWGLKPLVTLAAADPGRRAVRPTRLTGPAAAAALLAGWAVLVAIIALPLWYVSRQTPPEAWMWWTAGGCVAAYLMAGYLLDPQPEFDSSWQMVFDNPFSFEDDANRFLLTLQVMLFPAKVSVWAVVTTLEVLRDRRAGDDDDDDDAMV